MATMKSRTDRLERLHRTWMEENAGDVREYALHRIDASIRDGSLHSLREISSNLGGLATYYGIHGTIAMLDGKSDAWQHVHRSCLLHLWVLKLESSLFHRLADSTSLTFFVPRMACSLCYTIVTGADDWRALLVKLLAEAAANSNLVMPDYWHRRRFEPFAFRLNDISRGADVREEKQQDLGVYTQILSNWYREEPLTEALLRACDYHCENMEDRGGEWDPEFDHSPFDLIPWEILAVQKVRQRLGLSTPTICHPLANPSIMIYQPAIHLYDETIDRVEGLYRQYCGS